MKNLNHDSIVFQEDCMITMSRYPSGYFDLAVVDVPYGINVSNMKFLTERGTNVRQKSGKVTNAYGSSDKRYAMKDWDLIPPPQAYFDELCRVSRRQIIFGITYVDWTGVGPGRIMWDKGVAEGASFRRYETAYASMIDHTETIPLLWSGMPQAKDLMEPMRQQGNKKLNEQRIHPCHKPVLLYKRLYLDYGFEGMKVIDTHVGGGSSQIAAYDYDCEYVGSEIDPEYWELREQRFKEHTRQLSLYR